MSALGSIGSSLEWANEQLKQSDSARLDARILLCHALGVSATYVMTWPEKTISAEQLAMFKDSVLQRAKGLPIAYITGVREFWTLTLRTNPHTLIPRPETELLVEQALKLDLPDDARVLDLGTGTGAIALALASERQNWQLLGLDKIPDAVILAQDNARLNNLSHVLFRQSDWFSAVPQQCFDLIVSNPPYVESASPYLDEGDVRFEPKSALISGMDGLDDIRHIAASSLAYLNSDGWLMFEHGSQQGKKVRNILQQAGFSACFTVDDLNGLPRISAGKKIIL